MNDATLQAITNRDVVITVHTRDLGNGSENFVSGGRFTGEVDTWGKWTFRSENGSVHYLFADEVTHAESTSPVVVRREGNQRHVVLFGSEVVASFPSGKLALQAGERLARAFQNWQDQQRTATA